MTEEAPDRDEIEAIAQAVDSATAGSEAYYEIDSHLGWSKANLTEMPSAYRDAAVAATAAFQYTVRHGRRQSRDSPFIPMFTLEDGTEIPPAPRRAPQQYAQVWANLLDHLTHPAALARFADLLFVRGSGEVQRYADIAITAYLELSGREWHGLDQSHGLLRALDIARLSKRTLYEPAITDAMRHFVDVSLADVERSGPGAVLPVVERLLDDVSEQEQIQLIQKCLRAYEGNVGAIDSTLAVARASIKDTEKRRQFDQARFANLLDSANSLSGAQKLFELERALKVAEKAGLQAEAETARISLQSIKRDDLHLQTFRHEFSLPKEVVDEYIAQFAEPATWQEAIDRASLHRPLTGEIEENRELVEASQREAPIASSLRRIKLGSDGLPRWQAETDEQDEDARLAEQETFRLQLSGPLFALGLRAIGEKYSIDDDELRRHFAARASTSIKIVDGLCAAYRLFWSGSYNAAAYVAVFQVEAAAREVLLSANSGLYQAQRKQRPAQYPSLGFLLKELARLGLSQSWYRYLWTVFASPAGLNLRNEVAHGFGGELGEVEAAVALHCVSYLTMLKTVDGEQSSDDN